MTSFRSRTLTEYFQIIWRRKLLIFLLAVGMLISTFFVIEKLPDVYEARATVVTSAALTDRQIVNTRVASTTERLGSRAFLEPVIKKYDPYNNAKNVEAAIADLRQDMKIDTTYRADYPERLTITYRHTDPAVAMKVATELVSVFGKMNDAVEKQASDNLSALATEINDTENKLRQVGKLRSDSAARRGAAGAMTAARAQRVAIASSIETLTDKQYSLEQQIAEQKKQIEEQQKIVKIAPGDAKGSSSYGVLLVRKAELEGQLNDYSTQYTDKNPKIIQARNQLSEINRQIAQLSAGDQGSGPVNSAEARELRSMQRELARMQTELTITQRELGRKRQNAPGIDTESTTLPSIAASATPVSGEGSETLQGDSETLRKRYDALLSKQDLLQRAQIATAGLDPGVFQLVDVPNEPKIPIGPNRAKYRWFAAALSLGFALLVAFALEIPKLYSITDDRDVEYYLGVPVIALIPEAESDGRSRKLLLGRAASAVLIALLVSAVFFLMTYLQVFTQFAALLR